MAMGHVSGSGHARQLWSRDRLPLWSRPTGKVAMTKVLLVEDDPETAREIIGELTQFDYVVDWAADGSVALAKARSAQFNIMIVDRMLPGCDGLQFVETLRRERISTPILVLSALGSVNDRVNGLRAGGDDYLTKPFASIELVARVEALLRRTDATTDNLLRVGPLVLDVVTRTVKCDGRVVDLLPREFKLLHYMMQREGQVLTRTMLLEDVWNYRYVPQSNLVDVHVGRLRRKIEQENMQPLIHSIRGQGFMLRAPA
jgi:two-component system OmpR family response regulator